MKIHLFVFLLAISTACAQDSATAGFASSIPAGSLKDPLGNVIYTSGKLNRPVVIIFSVPSMAQGGNQKGWAIALGPGSATQLPGSFGFYLVENMKQAGFGATMARDEMKKKYHVGDRPILLLDESGEEASRFGIPRNSTCVLVYDRSNRLVHVEKGPATSAAVARVMKVVSTLK